MTRYEQFYVPTSPWVIGFAWVSVLAMFAVVIVGGVVSVDYIVTHIGDM